MCLSLISLLVRNICSGHMMAALHKPRSTWVLSLDPRLWALTCLPEKLPKTLHKCVSLIVAEHSESTTNCSPQSACLHAIRADLFQKEAMCAILLHKLQ